MVKQTFSGRPPKKQKSKAPAVPRTASEFQEAADFEEETGGKWRAGDAAKSARAFVRALDIYDRGLERFPNDFDLAYNKARLQLEISQQPAIARGVGLPLEELLRRTLESHRFALRLNSSNPDVLFNTAQVLASLGEHLLGQDRVAEAVNLLHEALELLSTCYSRQEMMMEQQMTLAAAFEKENETVDGGGVLLPSNPTPSAKVDQDDERAADNDDDDSGDGEAATVEIPVSASDILDTIQSSTAILTNLVSHVDASALQTLGEMAQVLTEEKALPYLSQIETTEQGKARLALSLERANFIAAFADAQFKHRLIDVPTYVSRITAAFEFEGKDQDVMSLVGEAEARQELALSTLAMFKGASDIPADVCWKQLSLAQTGLSKATQAKTSSDIFLSRGDVEMYRHRVVSLAPTQLSEAARNSAPTLLQNAHTYYRNAAKLANSEDAGFEKTVAQRLSLIVQLRNILYDYSLEDASQAPRKLSREELVEAVEDGLLDSELAEMVFLQLES